MNRILLGDCLIESDKIETGSVDLILTDLPYGTIKGMELPSWSDDTTAWDNAIDPLKIFTVADRVLRKNGKLVLFSQEPYTTNLVVNALPNIPFSYRLVWEKDNFANHLGAKKAPVNYTEDILVFSKKNPKYDFKGDHPLRPYFEQIFIFIGKTKKVIFKTVGNGTDHCFRFSSSQFSLCTEETYIKLIEAYKIDVMPEFMTFSELTEIDAPYKAQHNENLNIANPATFNLWEGNKSKSNIFKYKKDYPSCHPTQKPVPLLEDIIKTYSNEGDHVVDLTAGSGSTAVACQNTNRRFTVIEMNEKYYNTIIRRTGFIIKEWNFENQLDF